MKYDDPKFIMQILDFENMADGTLAMIMNNSTQEARAKVFKKLTDYQMTRIINGVPNITGKIIWSKMKPKFVHLDINRKTYIDNKKVTLGFLKKKYFTPWIMSTIIEATLNNVKQELLHKMALTNLKRMVHGEVNVYDKREYRGAYLARTFIEKKTPVVDGKLLMSGVKRKDIMNEGWITFAPGTDLEREYTLKEYCELLFVCSKIHYEHNHNGKYKPGMPLYERTINYLMYYYFRINTDYFLIFKKNYDDRSIYGKLVGEKRYKQPHTLDL